MEIISAKDARSRFAELLESAKEHPVKIQKHDKDFAVLLSTDRYKELVKMEEEMLTILAREIDNKSKYLNKEKSNAVIDDILNA